MHFARKGKNADLLNSETKTHMHRAGQRCFPGVDHEGRQTFRL